MPRSVPPLFPLLSFALLLVVGCAQTREITITTRPPDANIKVDNVDRGHGQVTEKMVFNDKDSTHTVTVSRLGFKEQTATLRRDYQVLTYLVQHASGLQIENFEERLLVWDYKLMQAWYSVTKTAAPEQARYRPAPHQAASADDRYEGGASA